MVSPRKVKDVHLVLLKAQPKGQASNSAHMEEAAGAPSRDGDRLGPSLYSSFAGL